MLDLVMPIIVLSGQSFGKNWSIGPVFIGQMIQNAPTAHYSEWGFIFGLPSQAYLDVIG